MRYKSIEEAQQDHIKNYRSNGVNNKKDHPYSASYNRVQWIVQHVRPKTYVLDVGCNAGTISRHLLKKDCYVKGIDIVEVLVKAANKNGIFAQQGTAEDLSMFDNESFDHVICTEVLEHLYEPMVAIKEAYRVLKKGGVYVVTVPHPKSAMSGNKLGDYHHQNFTMEILDTMFHNFFERGKCGFDEIGYNPLYCRANGYNPNVPQWLGLVAEK